MTFQEALSCNGPKGTEDLRLNHPELAMKEAAAGSHFVGKGGSVHGWTAFNHIGNENLLPGEVDGCKNLCQELTCVADKRLPPKILIPSRAFSNEDEESVRVPYSWNSQGPSPVKGTSRTGTDLSIDLFNGFHQEKTFDPSIENPFERK